jgi:hypothetical protein
MIDYWRRGLLPNRFLGVKNILDDKCESENNKFPTNEAVYRADIIFIMISFLLTILRFIAPVLVIAIHAVGFIIQISSGIFFVLAGAATFQAVQEGIAAAVAFPAVALAAPFLLKAAGYGVLATLSPAAAVKLLTIELKTLNLPIMLYDQCEFCSCSDGDTIIPTPLPQSAPLPNVQPDPNVSEPLKLSPSATILTFNGPYEPTTNVIQNTLYSIFRGVEPSPVVNDSVCDTRVPDIKFLSPSSNGASITANLFTSSLTLFERLNLFNDSVSPPRISSSF